MSERALHDVIVTRVARVTRRALATYAAVVVVVFAVLSLSLLRRGMAQAAAVVESLIGLYADPGGDRTMVAPAMLAEQLARTGSRFVITRRAAGDDGRSRTYYLSPDMPAREIAGVGESADGLRERIIAGLGAGGWRVEVLHHRAGEFDIYVAGSRVPTLLGIASVALAVALLLPLASLLARQAASASVVEALQPVEALRGRIAGIGPDDLSVRVATPTGLAETSEIAEAVNRLIVRVEGAQRSLTAFTADASHELSTPLTFLRAQLQWLLDDDRTTGPVQESIAAAHVEAERMHRLVESLLLLARGDASELSSRHESFDLGALTREVAEIGASMAADRPVAVRYDGVMTPTLALADADQVRQILLNLVSNAVRYTPVGSVTLRLESEADWVAVSVADTGIGIDTDDLPRVFDRFVRAENSRSRESGGAGLGLAIARMLARHQQGELTLTSTVGEGSVFRLRLRPGSFAPTQARSLLNGNDGRGLVRR